MEIEIIAKMEIIKWEKLRGNSGDLEETMVKIETMDKIEIIGENGQNFDQMKMKMGKIMIQNMMR